MGMATATPDAPIATLREAAGILGISQPTVVTLQREGLLPRTLRRVELEAFAAAAHRTFASTRKEDDRARDQAAREIAAVVRNAEARLHAEQKAARDEAERVSAIRDAGHEAARVAAPAQAPAFGVRYV
jgi:hypothetical protein